jgi:hypothetical protein
MIKWDVDSGQAGWALGSVDGIAAEMETGHYVADMTQDVALWAEKEIQRQIDQMAMGGAPLEHVYEFKKSGLYTPADRLFNVFQTGSGSRRALSFTFIPSSRGGPSIKDRIQRGELAVSASDKVFRPGKRSGKAVSLTKRFVFVNKASMMETGASASIRPKNKKIFVPFRSGYSGDRPYAFLSGSNISLQGNRHQGQFAAAWKIAAADTGIRAAQYVQDRFATDVKRVNIRQGGISKKTFAVAFADGKRAARAVMNT